MDNVSSMLLCDIDKLLKAVCTDSLWPMIGWHLPLSLKLHTTVQDVYNF